MKKMLILMLVIFVLSLSSIVSAHSIQENWSNANYQMRGGDDQPSQPDQNDPPESDKHKHEKNKPQPEPEPQPTQPTQPTQHDPR